MKPLSSRRWMAGLATAMSLTLSTHAAVTVDGSDDGSESYTTQTTQTVAAGWGTGNAIANLKSTQNGAILNLFLGGRTDGNAIILFIDSKPGGVSNLTNNLLSGGDAYILNNLATSNTAGLTFESGFQPDFIVRVFGNADAPVNIASLQSPTSVSYIGNSATAPVSGSFVTSLATYWSDVPVNVANYGTVTDGIEMALNLNSLGVSPGPQTVKLMAVLVNGGSTWGSNQVLPSRTVATDMAAGVNSINFETEDGTQTLTLNVEGPPAILDPNGDEDEDGLLNSVETNTGTFIKASNTGTDPFTADTDGDTYSDFDEVTSSALGYLSNPNIPNYEEMTVPGAFNLPTPWTPGISENSPSTDMTRAGTGITAQYQWSLNYRFPTPGQSFEYKYAAGSWSNNWGRGATNADTVKGAPGNFTATIVASGAHRFSFDQTNNTQSLTRTTFPNIGAYLAAYGLSDQNADSDTDSLTNLQEFALNTDPTNPNTDGDAFPDNTDADPLIPAPQTRQVTFVVNMSVQQALGNFNPATGDVVVKFFSGIFQGQPDLDLNPVGNGLWQSAPVTVNGLEGTPFGTFKFFNTTPAAPNGGYEEIDDRSFNLGADGVAQTIFTGTYFSNNTTLPGITYADWASANAASGAANEDADGDGISNAIEYFMGETGNTFTANPTAQNGIITWPRSASATEATFVVKTSPDLETWTAVEIENPALQITPNSVSYTLPTGETTLFVRLEVTVPAAQ